MNARIRISILGVLLAITLAYIGARLHAMSVARPRHAIGTRAVHCVRRRVATLTHG